MRALITAIFIWTILVVFLAGGVKVMATSPAAIGQVNAISNAETTAPIEMSRPSPDRDARIYAADQSGRETR